MDQKILTKKKWTKKYRPQNIDQKKMDHKILTKKKWTEKY